MMRLRTPAGTLSLLLIGVLGAADAADQARKAAAELKHTIEFRLARATDRRKAYDRLLTGLPRHTLQRGGTLLRTELTADQAWFDVTVVKSATASDGFSTETRTVRLCAHIVIRFPAGQRSISSMTNLNCRGDLAKTDPQLGTIDKVVLLAT